MEKKDFERVVRDMGPILKKLDRLLEKYNISTLFTVTCSKEGYCTITDGDGLDATRLSHGRRFDITRFKESEM